MPVCQKRASNPTLDAWEPSNLELNLGLLEVQIKHLSNPFPPSLHTHTQSRHFPQSHSESSCSLATILSHSRLRLQRSAPSHPPYYRTAQQCSNSTFLFHSPELRPACFWSRMQGLQVPNCMQVPAGAHAFDPMHTPSGLPEDQGGTHPVSSFPAELSLPFHRHWTLIPVYCPSCSHQGGAHHSSEC